MFVENLKVYWRYPGNNETYCYIKNLENILVAKGVAKLYHLDKYNKHIGRKVSFKKAISEINSKSIRKKLWQNLIKESPKTLKFGKL